MLVPSPTAPKHTVARNHRGRENSTNATSANFSARRTVWQNPSTWRLPYVYHCAKNSARFPDSCCNRRTPYRKMHAVLLLFRPLPKVGIQNVGMWGMYNLAKAYRGIKKSIANRPVKDWEASNGCTKDTTRLFHGPWHDRVGEHICAQLFRMWNRLRFHPFLQVSQIFQRRKSDANKQDFENMFNFKCQAQSTPKTIGILIKVFCTSGPNLVVLAWTGDELWHGQAQNGVNFDFEGKFDLEGNGQSPLKTTGILTKVFYTCVSNLVILAWTGLELWRGQTRGWRTHTQTDRRRQQQYPKAKTGLG